MTDEPKAPLAPPASVNVAGLQVRLRRVGPSAPDPATRRVVLVHGMAETLRIWELQQQALTDVVSVAYDLRGHGGTALGAADGTLDQLGTDLVNLLEREGPSVVCGFSLGGTIALWAAARRPDLVVGVAALATSSKVGRQAAAYYRERIEVARWGTREQLRQRFLDDARGFAPGEVSQRDADAIADARLAAIGNVDGYANAAAAMHRMHREPLTPALSAVRCPTLLVSGERDRLCPQRAIDIMREAMPHARHRQVPGAGHLLHRDAPAALTDVVREALSTGNGSAPQPTGVQS